jgi:hypothetical protein
VKFIELDGAGEAFEVGPEGASVQHREASWCVKGLRISEPPRDDFHGYKLCGVEIDLIVGCSVSVTVLAPTVARPAHRYEFMDDFERSAYPWPTLISVPPRQNFDVRMRCSCRDPRCQHQVVPPELRLLVYYEVGWRLDDGTWPKARA